MKPVRFLGALGVAALAFVLPFTAGAAVKREGTWPGVEKRVDLDFEGKPSEGLERLAKAAGWSLVVTKSVAVDGSGDDVRVRVDDQPADAVLDALFAGRDVVAYRSGALVTITPAPAAASAPTVPTPPVLPAPPIATADTSPPAPAKTNATDGAAGTPATANAPPIPSVRGEDRSVVGGSLVIRPGEIVHTVTVAGGSLVVEGTVTGDLVVAGGSAKVRSGGRVVGNATVFGGALKIDDGGRVDGDVGVVGGTLKRAPGAIIGGRVVDDEHRGDVKVTVGDEGTKTAVTPSAAPARSRLSEAARSFGQSMTRMALLFVLGCVLLALLAPRMERLRLEVASRPMRSFAVGLVGALLGSVGAALLVVILCVTVIGIPVAIVGVLLAVLAVYGAIASVLTTAGAAVLGHRTQNPYLHLLSGCAAFLVLSSIPWVGGLVTLAVTMIAVGALVTTRVGGLLERRRALPGGLA